MADSQGGERPQYLLVGVKGPEGQACDFTQLRVFTWGRQSQRYETAYVASDLCGKLPVKITRQPGGSGDAAFSFQDLADTSGQERVYQMHQTVVRRVKQAGEAGRKSEKGKRPHG